MKTLSQLQSVFPSLPKWFDDGILKQTEATLEGQGLLHAVKFVRETSKSIDNSIDLKASKDICDYLRLNIEPTIRISLSEFKRHLKEAFMKGVDFETERQIDLHSTSIGPSKNPYGNIDSFEAYELFENSKEIQNALTRFY